MLQSLIIAFSTYSKIPMPHVKWDEKAMRYSMCFFPLVGAIIGACGLALYYLSVNLFGCSSIFTAAILTVLPILVTGGIHMDGFLDTVDAKSSYKSAEEKLEILKDPHTGAFAIIFGLTYFVLYFGFIYEAVESDADKLIMVLALGYIYTRALSGFSVVTLKKAKRDGMLAKTANAANIHVRWTMLVWIVLCIAGMLAVNICYGIASAMTGILVFIYYRHMAYKTFGGITGDLAGYFLQTAELLILIVLVLVQRVVTVWYS